MLYFALEGDIWRPLAVHYRLSDMHNFGLKSQSVNL